MYFIGSAICQNYAINSEVKNEELQFPASHRRIFVVKSAYKEPNLNKK